VDPPAPKAPSGAPRRAALRRTYDAVTDEYVRRIYNELDGKPLDRELLDRFAGCVREIGPVGDVGCGPGQVARYLHDRGVTVVGIDLSDAMVAAARRLNPGIEFKQGDMTALDLPDGTWAGIVCFYSIIHIPRDQVVAVLLELCRLLRPGGLLLLTFHIGAEVVPDEMAGYLTVAGFEIEEIIERDPYPEVEHPSRRTYIFARRPVASTAGA